MIHKIEEIGSHRFYSTIPLLSMTKEQIMLCNIVGNIVFTKLSNCYGKMGGYSKAVSWFGIYLEIYAERQYYFGEQIFRQLPHNSIETSLRGKV